jgi:hypothetical protein
LSLFVFVSERGSPFTTAGFARMIERAAAGAGLERKAHPHILRRACGYALANKGHDTRAIRGWLGHRSITSTAVYTALAPNRFKDSPVRRFWSEWAEKAGWPNAAGGGNPLISSLFVGLEVIRNDLGHIGVYAMPRRSYRQLLIPNVGGGYHVLLHGSRSIWASLF